jgi:hypothetical protein
MGRISTTAITRTNRNLKSPQTGERGSILDHPFASQFRALRATADIRITAFPACPTPFNAPWRVSLLLAGRSRFPASIPAKRRFPKSRSSRWGPSAGSSSSYGSRVAAISAAASIWILSCFCASSRTGLSVIDTPAWAPQRRDDFVTPREKRVATSFQRRTMSFAPCRRTPTPPMVVRSLVADEPLDPDQIRGQ